MPRFYFNFYDGIDMFNIEGTDLTTVKEVRVYMLTMATEILLSGEFQNEMWKMEVLDEQGRIVASMNFGEEA